MAELNELAGVAIPGVHQEDDCPFCREDEPMEERTSDVEPDLEEDPGKQIGNNSGKLDKNMAAIGAPRPVDWFVEIEDADGNPVLDHHPVTPNPHHLIPGNESLKKADALLEWIFASRGTIAADIGYDVNNAENGAWLPSNNAMRGNSLWRDERFKRDYVRAAMAAAGGHFHDRHGRPYSAFVTKLLNKIADRINAVEAGDPGCPNKDDADSGKLKPPYGLVERLNGVSRRIAPYLEATDAADEDLYTSKLVPRYWWGDEGGSG